MNAIFVNNSGDMLRWLIAAMVVAKIVNYLYVKIPDNAEEPWKLRIASIQSYLVGDLVSKVLIVDCLRSNE